VFAPELEEPDLIFLNDPSVILFKETCMSAALIVAVERKKLVRLFREAGATDREHTVTLEALGVQHSWMFDQMLHDGVFQATDDGRYFMNDATPVECLHGKRIWAVVFSVILILFFLILLSFKLLR
jgi:hypothetical protein